MVYKIISVPAPKTNLPQEINKHLVKSNIPKWLSPTSPWFAFGQQLVWAYTNLLDYKDKKMLDVLADGDLGLIALEQGAKKYVSFDVSQYACAFYELKLAAIKALEQKEFTQFFIPKEIQRPFPAFTFREPEILRAFNNDVKKIEKIKNKLFREFKTFEGVTKYVFDYNLIKNKSAKIAKIEPEIKKIILKNTNPQFAAIYNQNFYQYEYPLAINNPDRENKLFNWETYNNKLRPLLDKNTQNILDPLIYNSYLDEKNELQPYARLVTIEEITGKKIDVIKYLTSKKFYNDLKEKLLAKEFDYDLRAGFDLEVLDKAIKNGEKYDIVSFSNVPTYKNSEKEREELFAKVNQVLAPKGIFVFHINDPKGRANNSDETRESVYKNRDFSGFKLIKYLDPNNFSRQYMNQYAKDYGCDNSLLMYQKIN